MGLLLFLIIILKNCLQIQLEQPLTFNEYVQPIVLPEQSSIPEEGTNCTVAGWGTISVMPNRCYNMPENVIGEDYMSRFIGYTFREMTLPFTRTPKSCRIDGCL